MVEQKKFKAVFYYRPGGHIVQQSGMVRAFWYKSPKEHCRMITSKSMRKLRRRRRLKVFKYLALAAILFNRANGLSNFCRGSSKDIPL